MIILLIQMTSVNFNNTLWLSEDYRNLNNTIIQTDFKSGELLLHFRDYRFNDTTALYGERYSFNLFRGLLELSSGRWRISVGDNDVVFGRGLSLFLSTDDKALLESYLRGVKVDYGPVTLYGGFKRKFIYYTGDKNPQYVMGIYTGNETAGMNGGFYSDTMSNRGIIGSAYIQRDFESMSIYLEGAYRYGYDMITFSRNQGYGLFLSANYFLNSLTINMEAKDYYRLSQGFNLPAPANEYELLSSDGRYERGISLSIERGNLRGSISQDWNRNLKKIMEYYSFTKYSLGILSYKFSAYRLWWRGNLDDYVGFLEVKYSPSWGIIVYGEYRRRKGEHQPMASIAFIRGGLNLNMEARYYFNHEKWDYFITARYDNLNNMYVEVSYGEFSGDIVCSSGVCRYEPPFKGLKVSAGYLWSR